MTRYASNTNVSVEKSKVEIEKIVRRYGADGFISGWSENRATIQFHCQGRHVKFVMDLPDPKEKMFTMKERGYGRRTESATQTLWEQACRQKWRALGLLVKAKLEAIESKIGTFESEFLANIVLPDGSTVYERTKRDIAIAYERGEMPPLLGFQGKE